MNDKYIVYMHTSPNNKKYIGITSQHPNRRWRKNGDGYKDNPYFWRAIQKYGWDSFTHKVLYEGLTKEQATELEICLIEKYNTTNTSFGYNSTIGGEGHTIYRTEEEKRLARERTLEKYYDKLSNDPVRLENIKQQRRDHANAKYRKLQENTEKYEIHLEKANAKVKARKQDPVEYQKILESKKRCKKKAMQDPDKRAKILEANRTSKQTVKAIREQLFDLYKNYPEAFTAEDLDTIFTKFSPGSGCFKYNSAKHLQQILDEVSVKVGTK